MRLRTGRHLGPAAGDAPGDGIWIEDLSVGAWQRLSAGESAKGPRLYDWAHLSYNGVAKVPACAPLVRRSVSDPDEVTFYLTHAPSGTGLAELVRVAGTRWAVESLFEQAKGEVGLDQYEVRSWIGWHRHVTLSMFALSMFALACLAVARRNAEPGAAGGMDPANLKADLLPLTVPEIRRLIAALAGRPPAKPNAVLRWSIWRRRHQQRAKRAHRRQRAQKRSSETRL